MKKGVFLTSKKFDSKLVMDYTFKGTPNKFINKTDKYWLCLNVSVMQKLPIEAFVVSAKGTLRDDFRYPFQINLFIRSSNNRMDLVREARDFDVSLAEGFINYSVEIITEKPKRVKRKKRTKTQAVVEKPKRVKRKKRGLK